MHQGQSPGGRDFDQRTVVRGVAVTGAVEVAIGAEHQPIAIRPFVRRQGVQGCLHSGGAYFVNDALAATVAR